MPDAPDGQADAPEIAGYTHVRPIGHGGFSDVYLYEQTMPRRQVAIKVLRTDDLSETSREQFAAEANLMARVSNHSNIAAIYAADVDDEGQPFLVMEYCSGGSLGAFYRHYPMSVKDVLSLGIRLAGALEAAHRAGIVHRDVKPANILLTEYGVPVLSDFGISTIDEDFPEHTRQLRQNGRPGTGESSVGMSLPWAAPETLWDVPVSDARSDRYSLTATLYSLLEGRSPHEVPGGPNSASHLTGRIQSGFIGQMKRPDLPPSLQAILRRGLSHDRAARFDSAADMGRALQDVQRELGFEVTPLEVPRGEAPARPPEAGTRVQQAEPIALPAGHVTLQPQDPGPQPQTVPPPPAPAAAAPASFGTGPSQTFGSSSTGWSTAQPAPQQGWSPAPQQPHPPQPPVSFGQKAPTESWWSRWRVTYAIVIAMLVLACVVVASLLIGRAASGPTYDGRAVDNLEVSVTGSGVYEVTIPPSLAIPSEAQIRVLETADGEPGDAGSAVDLSVDSETWQDDSTVTLNPLESANVDDEAYLSSDALASLGLDPTQLHEGDILLIAAPVGYFANSHPELGVSYSDATLVILQVVAVY